MKLYEISFTKSFSKSLKRFSKSGRFDNQKLLSTIDLLASGKTMSSNLKDHALRGEWVGYRECHIESDLLLIYKIKDNQIIISYLGTNSELFG